MVWIGFPKQNENMWGTPMKQGTSDILGKISFWYHCKKRTCSFNLIPKSSSYFSYFLRYDHLCIRLYKRFLWKYDFEKSAFKVSSSIVLDMTGYKKFRFFCEKCLKICQMLYGGDRKHIKVWKTTKISKSIDESFFTPMPTSIVHISK